MIQDVQPAAVTGGILAAGAAGQPTPECRFPMCCRSDQSRAAHWHTMQTNGEAADFVMYRNEFVDNSSELSPYGRDHIAEIAARMPSTPFPVIVQRSWNNADPELDQVRRDIVVRVLTDLGNQDANQRVVVSQPYSNGINSMEAEQDYGQFRRIRGNGNSGFSGGGGGGGSGGGGGF